MEVIQSQQTKTTEVNKELRIEECKANCIKQYEILKEVDAQDKENTISKKKAIQILAREMEEVMILQGQEHGIKDICTIICRNLASMGLSRGMHRYPVECLDRKYKISIDHNNAIDVRPPDDRIEQSCIYADKIKEAFTLIESLDYEGLQRSDIQDFAERANKLPKRIYDECERRKIATYEENKDYKSPPQQYQERVSYPKTKPARTVFVEAIERHIKAWIHVKERVELEGMDPNTNKLFQTDEALKSCADGLDQMTVMLDPITDRKYRKTWLQWYKIVKHARAWFKHSAARKFEVKDFEEFLRQLTREQIGFRMSKDGSITFDQVVKLFPGYFQIYTCWYPQVAERLGAQFSRMLHPKLSDRSIS